VSFQLKIDDSVFQRAERFLFFALVIIFLFPIWSLDYFPTLDSPGHVYNGKILWELLFGDATFYQSAYVINDQLSPNWFSQCLLAVLSNLASPFLCEKIIHSIYVVGFAFGFRMMVKSWKQAPVWLPLLGFTFIYNATMILGFLNFNLGIALLLWSIGLFHRTIEDTSLKKLFLFFVVITLLYFTHLVAIVVFFLYVLSWFIIDLIDAAVAKQRPAVFQNGLWYKLFMALIAPALLLVLYLLSDQEAGVYYYTNTDEITQKLIRFEGLFCFEQKEFGYARWSWFAVVGGIVMTLSYASMRFMMKKNSGEKLFSDIKLFFTLLLVTVLVVACAYVMPDASSGGGGMLTIRLVFFAGLFFVTSIFFVLKQKWISILMITLVTVVAVEKSFFIRKKQSSNQEFCTQIDAMSHNQCGNGVLLFLDFRGGWPLGHYSKVLANTNNWIAMDNLGAHKTFSPIKWKPEFRKDDEVLCYVGDQWNCRPANLPTALKEMDLYILKNGDYSDRESGPSAEEFWEKYFSDSCQKIGQINDRQTLYRRSN